MDFYLCHHIQTSSMDHLALYLVPGVLSPHEKHHEHEADHYHLVPGLKMHEPFYLHTSIAWSLGTGTTFKVIIKIYKFTTSNYLVFAPFVLINIVNHYETH